MKTILLFFIAALLALISNAAMISLNAQRGSNFGAPKIQLKHHTTITHGTGPKKDDPVRD